MLFNTAILITTIYDQADLKCALDISTLSPISPNTRLFGWTCGRRWKYLNQDKVFGLLTLVFDIIALGDGPLLVGLLFISAVLDG